MFFSISPNDESIENQKNALFGIQLCADFSFICNVENNVDYNFYEIKIEVEVRYILFDLVITY